MPMQSGDSPLFKKLGPKMDQAHEEHKDDAPMIGNPSLPDGIEGGVAKVIDIHFGEYKDGPNRSQPFFMAAATVVKPREHNGVDVYGQRTQIGPEPLCDTPTAMGKRKTFSDHYAWMLNQLKILGIDVSKVKARDLESTIQKVMHAIQNNPEAAIYTRFRTWKGGAQEIEERGGKWYVGARGPYKSEADAKVANPFAGREPRIQHEWNGACNYSDNGEAPAAAFQDATGPSDEEGAAAEPAALSDEETTTTEFSEYGDLESLVTRATNEDGDAQDRLREIALGAGVSEADVDGTTTWQELADLIQAQGGATAEEVVEETTEPEAPEKGQVWKYRPIGKDRKPAKKSVSVEVVAVDPRTETVALKNLDDKKTIYKGVKWAALSPA